MKYDASINPHMPVLTVPDSNLPAGTVRVEYYSSFLSQFFNRYVQDKSREFIGLDEPPSGELLSLFEHTSARLSAVIRRPSVVESSYQFGRLMLVVENDSVWPIINDLNSASEELDDALIGSHYYQFKRHRISETKLIQSLKRAKQNKLNNIYGNAARISGNNCEYMLYSPYPMHALVYEKSFRILDLLSTLDGSTIRVPHTVEQLFNRTPNQRTMCYAATTPETATAVRLMCPSDIIVPCTRTIQQETYAD